MDMIIINSPSHTLFEKMWHTYEVSFPYYEKRLKSDQIKALKDNRYMIYAISDQEKYIGFISIWVFHNYCFIEHFAIEPSERGKSYGKEIIRKLQQLYTEKVIILEIDPPNDDISMRRLAFYENLGFKLSDVFHLNLPYRRDGVGHRLFIMTYPNKISTLEYEIFNRFLNNEIIEYCET